VLMPTMMRRMVKRVMMQLQWSQQLLPLLLQNAP
jgi:hypothetical protein